MGFISGIEFKCSREMGNMFFSIWVSSLDPHDSVTCSALDPGVIYIPVAACLRQGIYYYHMANKWNVLTQTEQKLGNEINRLSRCIPSSAILIHREPVLLIYVCYRVDRYAKSCEVVATSCDFLSEKRAYTCRFDCSSTPRQQSSGGETSETAGFTTRCKRLLPFVIGVSLIYGATPNQF